MPFDAYLQIDGIEGESTDTNHSGWIEVNSFTFGAAQAVAGQVSTGGSLASGRTELKPFIFTHVLDKATPKIHQACTQGKTIAKVTLNVCRASASQEVYFEVTMEKVLISGVQLVGTPGSDILTGCELPSDAELPSEEVSMIPAKITWKYTETKKDGTKGGSIEASWDQSTNKGS